MCSRSNGYRGYAVEHFGPDDAVLVIDETGFLKQGKASCGVARQYTGSAGKATIGPAAWQGLSAGQGTEGGRLHDWVYFEPADLEADEYAEGLSGTWTRGLLIRRHVADGDLAFFTTWCPAGTTIETLVGVKGHR